MTKMSFVFNAVHLLWAFAFVGVNCILYPRDSESRQTVRLDGIWNFRVCSVFDQDVGFREQWYKRPLSETGDVIPMPVPSSYNDVTQNQTIRDYVGWAWYDTQFWVPLSWDSSHSRVFLRFNSAHYLAQVYVNGEFVVSHVGGHLPFGTEVTLWLKYGRRNRITVALNNTLTHDTIPQGEVIFPQDASRYPKDYYRQTVFFDFFNYAGIHRSVILFTTPKPYVDDVTITTLSASAASTSASVHYNVTAMGTESDVTCSVTVLNDVMQQVVSQDGCSGKVDIKNVQLWWPITMHPIPGYQYTLKVELSDGYETDTVYEKFGVRTVRIGNGTFFINDKPFYFRGFGKHEDSDIRGKGLDLPLIIKDFNLIRWIGANSFRTSHYPYADEIMDQADAQGIVVIEESPAVALRSFQKDLLKQHQERMAEMYQRDKNRPSVVMWSLANEPKSALKEAGPYFHQLAAYVRGLDSSRPITAALNAGLNDLAGQYLDVIMHNKYNAWYGDCGSLDVIVLKVVHQFDDLYRHYRKPIMMSEYGAGSIPGLHQDPPFVFTEDYHTALLVRHHIAFDQLRERGYFIGEHVWNFADFMTDQETTRVDGNRKGIFTRDRQPKAAARVIRCRYNRLGGVSLPDIDVYCPYG
ncbi:beta-glucuronidase-like isoform X1 [Ornithodoros turicata]|uniref:beta-glucuronidase-like isoform X1 n=1 Tax=Ornithodoros turicata TaxID=34597 RepID=UPI003139B82E